MIIVHMDLVNCIFTQPISTTYQTVSQQVHFRVRKVEFHCFLHFNTPHIDTDLRSLSLINTMLIQP